MIITGVLPITITSYYFIARIIKHKRYKFRTSIPKNRIWYEKSN